MATLNTLRTKFGIVLSAVIAFALLAFIFSLKSEMGFSGNDPVVVKIDGKDVTYTEYQAKYNEIKTQNGIEESSEEQISSLANATIQSFTTDNILTPGIEALGITVSDQERLAMINGEIPTQAFYSIFADQSTGMYDRQGVASFLSQASGNQQAEEAWAYVNNQARIELEGTKYVALLSGGVYVNSLEVKQGLASSNKNMSGRWAIKYYSDLADADFTVSSSEVSKYYEKNKSRYRKTPSRSLSYVAFDIEPTADDRLDIEKTAAKVGEEFAVTEDIRGYVRDNRYGSVASNYVPAGQLLSAETEAFAQGGHYGPVLSGDTWRISRVLDSREVPDTMGIRIIALPYTSQALADSLFTAIEGGADFAEIAAQHSMHQQSAQMGGDIGATPYSIFNVEMADKMVSVAEGSVVKVEIGDMIQIVQTYDVAPKTTHYLVASIEYPVVASQATINKAHADAGLFAVDAKGGVSNFNTAADKYEASAVKAVLNQGDRTITGLNSSREVARWAYGAKVGDVSEIFRVDGGYLVAMLTNIDDSKYTSLEDATPIIATDIRRAKKYEAIKKTLSGATFDEVTKDFEESQKGTFESVNFASYYIPGVGVEQALVGAIGTTTEVNTLSAPVKGLNGLCIFEVTSIDEMSTPLTPEAEKVRLQAAAENSLQQMILSAIYDMSNVEDLRGMYF